MSDKQKQIILSVVAVLIILLVSFGIYYTVKNSQRFDYDNFAKCLSEKDFTMYGAVWCSHCKDQKKMFGTSFQYIKYVECTENEAVCNAKGITGFPSWTNSNGEKFEGSQPLKKLSELSGCALPISK